MSAAPAPAANTLARLQALPADQRRHALQAMRRAGLGRRVYAVHAQRPGGAGPGACAVVVSAWRIRALACATFRRLFGTAPSFTWAAPGSQAEAWDDAGHRLHLRQINDL